MHRLSTKPDYWDHPHTDVTRLHLSGATKPSAGEPLAPALLRAYKHNIKAWLHESPALACVEVFIFLHFLSQFTHVALHITTCYVY